MNTETGNEGGNGDCTKGLINERGTEGTDGTATGLNNGKRN